MGVRALLIGYGVGGVAGVLVAALAGWLAGLLTLWLGGAALGLGLAFAAWRRDRRRSAAQQAEFGQWDADLHAERMAAEWRLWDTDLDAERQAVEAAAAAEVEAAPDRRSAS